MKRQHSCAIYETPINGSEIDIKPILCGYQQCPPLHTVGPIVRNYWLIHYCVSGKGMFFNQNGSYSVSAGEIFIICPQDNCTYAADQNDPWKYVWIGFSGSYAERLRALEPVNKYPHETFFKIRQLANEKTHLPEEYLALICELLHNLLKNTSSKRDVINMAKNYIKYCYMDSNVSVNTVAEHIHINRCYLSREFKKRFGITVRDYIIKQRTEAACRILADGYSVSEAALMLGYSDPFTFSKAFKAHQGMSPSEYRKNRAQSTVDKQ